MTVRHGIDYAFSRPNLDTVKAAGKSFVVRYISGGVSDKDLTRPELAAIRSRGLDVCLVWETGGRAALGGRARGVADATAAKAQVHALGMDGAVVYLAVDFDAVGSQLVTVVNYIAGAASVLGYDLTGVYGGYHVIETSAAGHVCRWFWQTYAWSYGKWSTAAQLRQVLNGQTLGRGTVDLCDAVVADFGQYPRPALAAPVPVTPGQRPAPSTKGARVYTPVGVDFGADAEIHPGDGPGRFIQEVQHYLHLPTTGVMDPVTVAAVKRKQLLALGRYGRGGVINCRFYRSITGHN